MLTDFDQRIIKKLSIVQSDKRKYQSYFQKGKKEGCREPHPPKGEL